YEDGRVSFKDVKTFNLDEYCDLPKDDKNSYYTFMHEQLFNHVDIKEENVNFLDGNAADWQQESKRYADALADAGGIDIQLLGIGTNGHIGFNEPADEFTDESFKVTLTQSTINSNQKYFGDTPMPRYALTMGIGSIMKAKKIILIATGESKAKAISGMINGEVTPRLPASVLNTHDDVIIMLDKAAASLL
ncbi:MAG: glucosamine-6-phosphate deaminase, partial [Clostridia bacterium]|nr:glucosamine-6-phosphate deaminase [Clostridia bacterium]